MEIKSTDFPVKPASLGTADLNNPQQVRNAVESWKSSQFLRAVVTETNPTQTRLNIGGIMTHTRTPDNLELKVGQQLTLQLTSKGEVPGLKIIDINRPVEQLINQQLRNTLPRQQPLTHLLSDIRAIISRPEIQRHLPADILNQVNKVAESIPQLSQLKTPAGVKQTLQHSGLFLEQQLGQAVINNSKPTGNTENSIHTLLLRLADILKQNISQADAKPLHASSVLTEHTMGAFQKHTPLAQASVASRLLDIASSEQLKLELFKQVEASLARMHTLQLASAKTDDTNNPLWAFEIPVKHNDNTSLFDIRIEQEQHGNNSNQAKHRWTLSIAFELEGLGKIYVRAALHDEKVSATFWLAEPSTHTLFNEHLTTLRSNLEQAGLEIDHITLSQGSPELNPAANWQRLLDEKA